MYQPVPLNWMAGAEKSFCISPPQVGHTTSGSSENFRMTSKRPQRAHWYSYSGTAAHLRGDTSSFSVDGLDHEDHDDHDQEDVEEPAEVVVGDAGDGVLVEGRRPHRDVAQLRVGEGRRGAPYGVEVGAHGPRRRRGRGRRQDP